MMSAAAKAQPGVSARQSIKRHLLGGVTVIAVLVGAVGGWAGTTEISGAVVAPAVFVVESNVKKVQHPTGGIVGELRVQDGDKVRTGQVVMRLDETVTQANLAIVRKTLDEFAARQARLEAERDGEETLQFPDDLLARKNHPDVARVVNGEQKVFDLRKVARAGQKAQLKERISQLGEEIQGLMGQIAAKKREVELITQELEGVRDLWRKNLIPIQRVTALERDAARLEGERGSLIAATAQTKGKISETELQILQIDQDLRSEVARELREIQAKMSEFVERKVAAEDQLKRIEIRAPQDGTVHQLNVHTVGGVVSPAEPIMLIVPASDDLTVEAKIAPQDIDQLRYGQRSVLRLSAFNQRTTPEINGEVSRISADLSTDQRTGLSYYTVRIAVPPAELARVQGLKVVPGMPVEVFIKTADRTVISYLTKPLSDHLMKAFRED
jgi:HlyD family secretion protein